MKNEQESRKVYSIAECLKTKRDDLVVSKSKEIFLNPDDKNYQRYFRTVKVTSIADLQALGILPREVDEEQIKSAIDSDDREAFELARNKYDFQSANCGCSHAKGSVPTPDFKQFHRDLRKKYNPSLEKVFASYYKVPATAKDLRVEMASKWALRIVVYPNFWRDVLGLFLKDMIVPANTNLVLSPSIDLVNVNNLKIYKGGKVSYAGSYLFMKCNSAQGNI